MMQIKPGDSETNCLVHCFLVFLKLSFVSLSQDYPEQRGNVSCSHRPRARHSV